MKEMTGNQRMALLALVILALDQFTKWLVLSYMGLAETRTVIPGFFKLVHWTNTGAAWSMFRDSSAMLAIVSLIALAALFIFRHHFDAHTRLGQIALGLMFGGIAGNLVDRLMPSRGHVIDFLYFHVMRRDGSEAGFPAFNVADSAICVGVAFLFVLSWQKEDEEEEGGEKNESENEEESKPGAKD